MKKFEFTGETKTISLLFRTTTLHRIRAVAEFGLVKIGDLGGWIEKEENLSHEGKAWVCGNAVVRDNAVVRGDAEVRGNAVVRGNARISGKKDFLVIGPIGSRNDYTTFFKNESDGISVSCGCFFGTIEEFLRKVDRTHGGSVHAEAYIKAAELAKLRITDHEMESRYENY